MLKSISLDSPFYQREGPVYRLLTRCQPLPTVVSLNPSMTNRVGIIILISEIGKLRLKRGSVILLQGYTLVNLKIIV